MQLYELLRPKNAAPEKRQQLVNQIITKVCYRLPVLPLPLIQIVWPLPLASATLRL